jgi:hypothetical protein
LENSVKFDNANNTEMKNMYDQLHAYIQQEKVNERKVFKSFFRNVNYKMMEQEGLDNNSLSENKNNIVNQFTEVKDEDCANVGKPQIRILNL